MIVTRGARLAERDVLYAWDGSTVLGLMHAAKRKTRCM